MQKRKKLKLFGKILMTISIILMIVSILLIFLSKVHVLVISTMFFGSGILLGISLLLVIEFNNEESEMTKKILRYFNK